ncbi:hypothetical protein [Actinokineospora xionganensis]|uniref:Uncharacterized protein n=1 Tax=Actinokineospora xionganensis TaxID=2684470 RepID=A0ABR7LG66_9PSEU|nr:hypothetical protein [Actinokineospora xionganensis]MBC6451640.1 hypothetical protein [Actinokineospora xionganensis]
MPMWVATAAYLPVVLLLAAFVDWLGRDSYREKQRDQIAVRFAVKHARPENRHDLDDTFGRQPVSVAELLEDAVREGRGVRLHWTEADTDPHGLVATPPDDDWPTVVLPCELLQRAERGHYELER